MILFKREVGPTTPQPRVTGTVGQRRVHDTSGRSRLRGGPIKPTEGKSNVGRLWQQLMGLGKVGNGRPDFAEFDLALRKTRPPFPIR